MDSAHWPQGIRVVDKAPMEGSKQPNNNNNNNNERRATTTRPQKDQAVNCPRCNSTNTKFCYYNNYSLTQPRFFCKTCRRYWTDGGSLRNVPVGGGSRKNKRSSSSSSISISSSSQQQIPSSSSNKKLLINNNNNNNNHDHLSPSLVLPPSLNFSLASQDPKLRNHQAQDLNLAYHDHNHNHNHHHNNNMAKMPFLHHYDNVTNPSSANTTTSAANSSSRGFMSSLMVPDHHHHHHQFSNSFPHLGHNHHHEFKPSLISFGLDHHYHQQGGYNNNNSSNTNNSNGNSNSNNNNNVHHGVVQETSGARVLFPSEDLKQVSNTNNTSSTHDQVNRGQGDNSTGGYNWNGMLGGEGSW